MDSSKMTRNIIVLIVVIIAGIAVYKMTMMPETGSPIERIGDAAKEMKDSATDTAKEIGDTVKDATKPAEPPAQ